VSPVSLLTLTLPSIPLFVFRAVTCRVKGSIFDQYHSGSTLSPSSSDTASGSVGGLEEVEYKRLAKLNEGFGQPLPLSYIIKPVEPDGLYA